VNTETIFFFKKPGVSSIFGIFMIVYFVFLGICHCKLGSYGSDCSMKLDEAPQLDSSTNPGLCDLTKTSCKVMSISAIGIIPENDGLTCRLQSFSVNIILIYCIKI